MDGFDGAQQLNLEVNYSFGYNVKAFKTSKRNFAW